MAQVMTGADALDIFKKDEEEGGIKNAFTPLKSGTTFVVKVPGINFISKYVYGNFENPNIHSFVAENESEKTSGGNAKGDLTPFDKAWKHFKEQSDDWQDAMSAKAGIYRAAQRITFGFYNLDDGEPIMVEFSRNQAAAIGAVMRKYEARLGQFAFELSKTGKQRDTLVSLSLIPMLEDLTPTQQENFAKVPDTFEPSNFEGLHFVMSDEMQIETLHRVGFDVTSIGFEVPEEKKEGSKGDAPKTETTGDNPTDISDDDLPF